MLVRPMAFYYATADERSADVVLLGMPLDRTSSFSPGTRFGPDFARIGADNIESFSPYQRRDVSTVPVFDAGNLTFEFAAPRAPLELIEQTAQSWLEQGRRLLAIGGEHSITPPIVRAMLSACPELCVVQFDAHSDLRDEFLGERECHATAMRRVLDVVPRERLFQLGIRSFAGADELTAPNLYPFDVLKPVQTVVRQLGARPVYLTLDLDVIDPAFMPEVQTPQPGGCSFRELAEALALFGSATVVGADIVEFCPRGHQPGVGAVVTAELVRELVLLLARRSAG